MTNPTKFSKEQILTKWGDLVQKVSNLKTPEDIQKVSEFAHFLAIDETIQSEITMPAQISKIVNVQATPNLLSMNLKLIGKINDLSNVKFTLMPISEDVQYVKELDAEGALCLKKRSKLIKVDTLLFKLKIDKDLVYSIQYTQNLIEEIENMAVDFVAEKINEILSKNHKLYIYKPISKLIRITETIEHIKPEQIDDNYVEYNIYSRWFEEKENVLTMNDI